MIRPIDGREWELSCDPCAVGFGGLALRFIAWQVGPVEIWTASGHDEGFSYAELPIASLFVAGADAYGHGLVEVVYGGGITAVMLLPRSNTGDGCVFEFNEDVEDAALMFHAFNFQPVDLGWKRRIEVECVETGTVASESVSWDL